MTGRRKGPAGFAWSLPALLVALLVAVPPLAPQEPPEGGGQDLDGLVVDPPLEGPLEDEGLQPPQEGSAPPESRQERLVEEALSSAEEPPIEEVGAGPGRQPPLPELGATAERPAPLVVAVEVRSDVPLEQLDGLRELIAVVPGEPLREAAVRQTLRNLQATGITYQVEMYTRTVYEADLSGPEVPRAGPLGEAPVWREEDRDRVEVVLALWAAVRVEDVDLEGDLGLDREDLEREIQVRESQALFSDSVLASVFRLQDLYEERGFFDATVRADVDVDEERKQARVVFRIEAGERARVGTVSFEGDLGPFSPAQLEEELRMGSGDRYRRRAGRDDVERLRGWLIEEGYRAATVELAEPAVDRPRRRVDLTYRVEVGPRIEVVVRGADLARLERRDLLPFLGEDGYDEALVYNAVDRIEEDYQERGHWQVEVDWTQERVQVDGREVLRLTFWIEPGPTYTLESLDFAGNEEISDERLEELVATSPRRPLRLGSGRLVEETLDADLSNLRSFYALQGFVGYEIGPPDIRVAGEDLHLVIPIEEGTRRQVVTLALVGVEEAGVDGAGPGGAEGERPGGEAPELEPERLREAIPLEAGGPFHPLLLEDSLRILRGVYEEAGYLAVQVSARQDWNADQTLVDLTIQVLEGPRTTIDRLIVRGLDKTVRQVVDNAIGLEPGDPVSPTRLLEAERRLYRLGIFSEVELELTQGGVGDATRDVLVRLEEGETQRISYGVSYDSDDGPGGLLGYSQRNLFGRAYTFQVDLSYRESQAFGRLILNQPMIRQLEIPVLYSLAYEEEGFDAYDVERQVARVEVARPLGRWRLGLTADYREVDSTLKELGADGEVERRDQDIRISSLIPSALYDRRDDPLSPTEGWSALGRLQYAFPIDGVTDADFLKGFFQTTGYLDLGYGTLAGSLRLGATEAFSDATGPEDDYRVPIDERFFAGGDFSHRAYDRDELWIRGETEANGIETGGNGLFLVNLDYRFPVFGDLGGVVFTDSGNIWREWSDLDLSQLKTGIGVGVRYNSPIGPIRAGIAWQLDPEPGVSKQYRLFLALGNPF